MRPGTVTRLIVRFTSDRTFATILAYTTVAPPYGSHRWVTSGINVREFVRLVGCQSNLLCQSRAQDKEGIGHRVSNVAAD